MIDLSTLNSTTHLVQMVSPRPKNPKRVDMQTPTGSKCNNLEFQTWYYTNYRNKYRNPDWFYTKYAQCNMWWIRKPPEDNRWATLLNTHNPDDPYPSNPNCTLPVMFSNMQRYFNAPPKLTMYQGRNSGYVDLHIKKSQPLRINGLTSQSETDEVVRNYIRNEVRRYLQQWYTFMNPFLTSYLDDFFSTNIQRSKPLSRLMNPNRDLHLHLT